MCYNPGWLDPMSVRSLIGPDKCCCRCKCCCLGHKKEPGPGKIGHKLIFLSLLPPPRPAPEADFPAVDMRARTHPTTHIREVFVQS
jgi:hypothetical protein